MTTKIKVLNKLARNNLHENVAAKGGSAVTRILTNQEYRIELNKKLQEELNEFLEDTCTEELADILEVIHTFAP